MAEYKTCISTSDYKTTVVSNDVKVSLSRTGPQGAPGLDGGSGLRQEILFYPKGYDTELVGGITWDASAKVLHFPDADIQNNIAMVALNGSLLVPTVDFTVSTNRSTITFSDRVRFSTRFQDEVMIITAGAAAATPADGSGNSSGGASVFVQETTPTGVGVGALWFDTASDSFELFVYDGSTWIVANGAGGGSGGGAGTRVHVGGFPPSTPVEGDLWFDTTVGGTGNETYVFVNNQWITLSGGRQPGQGNPVIVADMLDPTYSADIGDLWYETDSATLFVFDGNNWVDVTHG